MYPEWLASLVEPGIEAFEAETGETVNAIKLPGQGYDQRIALDLSAGTAADVNPDRQLHGVRAGRGRLSAAAERAWPPPGTSISTICPACSKSRPTRARSMPCPPIPTCACCGTTSPISKRPALPMPWEPKSWADVLDAAQKLKDAGVQYPFQLPAGIKQGEAATMQGVYMALLGADVPEGDRNRLLNRETNQWIGDSPGLRRTLRSLPPGLPSNAS